MNSKFAKGLLLALVSGSMFAIGILAAPSEGRAANVGGPGTAPIGGLGNAGGNCTKTAAGCTYNRLTGSTTCCWTVRCDGGSPTTTCYNP